MVKFKANDAGRWISRQRLIGIIVLLLVIYLVLPQQAVFGHSIHVLAGAKLPLVLMAGLDVATTYFVAAITYWLLAFKTLIYGRTVLVELASAFINRLLPSGIGGMSVNYAYLRSNGHSKAQAVAVIAVNNSLGLAGHLLLLALAFLLMLNTHGLSFNFRLSLGKWLITLLAVVFLLAVLSLSRRLAEAFRHFELGVVHNILFYKRRPSRLLLALCSSLGLTMLNIFSLWLCSRALNFNISLVDVIFVLTLGIGVGVVTPTPGGLIGVEAGLVAGLVAIGLTSSQALAIALLFRLLTFWLPLLAGGVAFVVLRSKKILGSYI